jgi:hypothetical protein
VVTGMGYAYNPLVLSHNGTDWHGTFGIALRVLADDMLADGPVECTIVVIEEREYGTAGRRRVTLAGRTADTLQLEDGSSVPITDVIAVEFP